MNSWFIALVLSSSLILLATSSKTGEAWKSRSVYQILTDRFARPDGDNQPCDNMNNYCGGTFKGIEANLDYIEGMGFDAIWISPVLSNTPGGYHGYWLNNLYEINEYFGSHDELVELIEACHQRDIWVMVDVVANHVGYVDNWDYSPIFPFNDASHYNPFIDCGDVDPNNQTAIETCWLVGLPDLDQNNPYVAQTLLSWAADFVKKYDFDALRIDTVPHVSKEFWSTFSKIVGVYTIGEILNWDMQYLAGYQGPLDGVLNYALYSSLRSSFQNGGSMKTFETYYQNAYATWPDISLLGNFVDNHDNPRFLSGTNNIQAFKAALAFTISSIGIPMVYYGDEQAFGGGADPANREPLWTNMGTDTEIYQFLKTLNNFRKQTQYYNQDQIQRYADDSFYAFTRGQNFFAFTNTNEYQQRTITYHPYTDGTVLCNLFHKDDCVEVKNGEFSLVLLSGEVKIFSPSLAEKNEAEDTGRLQNNIKMAIKSKAMLTSS